MDAPELPKDQEHTPGEPGPEHSPEENKPKRKRGQLSPEARRRKTAKQAVARELERVLSEGTTEEIEDLKRRLSTGDEDDVEAPPAAQVAVAPAPGCAVAPGVPPPAPGWPTHEATARARPLAELVVGTVSTCVGLMGVDLSAPRNLTAGTPPMNLVHGNLKQDRDGVRFIETGDGSIELSLSLADHPGAREFVGKPVVLGFRPEDIAVVGAPKGQGASAGTIPAVAEIVEPMGAETILHLQTGAHAIICRSGEVILRSETGRRMRFFIDPARIHLFDPASTLRVAKP